MYKSSCFKDNFKHIEKSTILGRYAVRWGESLQDDRYIYNEETFSKLPTWKQFAAYLVSLKYDIPEELAIRRHQEDSPEEYEEYNTYCEWCVSEAKRVYEIVEK